MVKRVPAGAVYAQCQAILSAWGMNAEHAQITAERLQYADLHGVDSHGIALLPLYARLRSEGRINFQPKLRVLRESAVTALLDADNGLGQLGGTMAMLRAIENAKTSGVGATAVRNSNHFGAAGAYAMLGAEAGLVGMAFSAAWDPAIVPTFGTEPRFGTNPIAVAAPAGDGSPFCFDIATSTVAIGKLRLAQLHDRPLQPGWALDEFGAVTTEPAIALVSRRLTPLGGVPHLGSHKGYGLAATVELLSTMLSGGWYCATRDPAEKHFNVGHFFLAIDPEAYRALGEFENDLQEMLATLRTTPPVDAGQPVLAPGDPEAKAFADRSISGIPLPDSLLLRLREIAAEVSAPWILEA